MRAVDLIVKKREGGRFSTDEIRFIVGGYTSGEIPDYQMSSLLMAVLLRGMSAEETAALTGSMIASGETLDLSGVPGPLVDKHSTGGVGDKISLILAPLAAACGVRVPMMSGRSLGHTGGTLDKLESIPGYRTDMSVERFRRALADIGFAMIGQSARIVPADRKMYALRDVTGTVESIPLITASIMSKKFAEGAKGLVFDVKCGSGAFMKNPAEAAALATSLTQTGRSLGRKVAAAITDMDQPLGRKIGNFLEVEETVDCLNGRGPGDVMELTYRLCGWMLKLGGLCATPEEGERLAQARLADGTAWKKFLGNVEFQGGDVECLMDLRKGPHARVVRPVVASSAGYLSRIDAYGIGVASVLLGAGRSRKEDAVAPGAGITLLKTAGDGVRPNDEIALLYGEDERRVDEAAALCLPAFTISSAPTARPRLIIQEMPDA